MPTYIYNCRACGTTFHRVVPIRERARQRCACGGPGKRDVAAEQRGFSDNPDIWRGGLKSEAMGVHPSQVAEARELFKESGVQFEPDGTAVFPTRECRRRHLQESGFVDLDGGYGDTYNRSRVPEPEGKMRAGFFSEI